MVPKNQWECHFFAQKPQLKRCINMLVTVYRSSPAEGNVIAFEQLFGELAVCKTGGEMKGVNCNL